MKTESLKGEEGRETVVGMFSLQCLSLIQVRGWSSAGKHDRSMKGLWPAEAADGVVCMCMWILIFIYNDTGSLCLFKNNCCVYYW